MNWVDYVMVEVVIVLEYGDVYGEVIVWVLMDISDDSNGYRNIIKEGSRIKI